MAAEIGDAASAGLWSVEPYPMTASQDAIIPMSYRMQLNGISVVRDLMVPRGMHPDNEASLVYESMRSDLERLVRRAYRGRL